MGGHSSETSWFRAKTDTLLRDVVLLQRSAATLQWALPDQQMDNHGPAAREFHTLTALATDHRLLLFGGGCLEEGGFGGVENSILCFTHVFQCPSRWKHMYAMQYLPIKPRWQWQANIWGCVVASRGTLCAGHSSPAECLALVRLWPRFAGPCNQQ